MSKFFSTLLQGILYRGREGHWSFIARRLSGLGTVLFLTLHILDTATVYFFPAIYVHTLSLYRSTLFMLGEIILVGMVIYHGVNGLNIILCDTFPRWWAKQTERQSFWRVTVLSLALWLPAAFWMGRTLYLNNICQCAPPAGEPVDLTGPLIGIMIAFAIVLTVLVWGRPLRFAQRATQPTGQGRSLDAWAWLGMRWSGALLIPLAWGHVLVQDVLVGVHAITLDYVALRWRLITWRAYDAALLAFAFAHGMNGLRGILNEYAPLKWQRVINWLMLIIWLAVTVIGATALAGGVQP